MINKIKFMQDKILGLHHITALQPTHSVIMISIQKFLDYAS